MILASADDAEERAKKGQTLQSGGHGSAVEIPWLA